MAEHSKFFDSLNPLDPDKVYTADEFIGYFEKLITTGVMKGESNMLKVETSGSNMNTIVDTGTAFLKAREYENDSKLSLTHEVEALGKSRIDRVVIRLMLNVDYREARAFVKKGVAGLAPVVPHLERTDEVYEISLAQVKVIGGQTYINVADVVDERGNPDVCPWAGSKILPNFNDAALAELVNDVSVLKGKIDSKANKQDPLSSVVTAVLQNGWTQDTSTVPLKFFKDGFGNVRIYGAARPGTKVGGTVISTLPIGYRSVSHQRGLGGVIGHIAAIPVIIYSDGRISLNADLPTTAEAIFFDITLRIDF